MQKLRIEPVYVSLFGANSLDDVRGKLLSSWIKRSTKKNATVDKVFDGIEKLSVLSGAAAVFKKGNWS